MKAWLISAGCSTTYRQGKKPNDADACLYIEFRWFLEEGEEEKALKRLNNVRKGRWGLQDWAQKGM